MHAIQASFISESREMLSVCGSAHGISVWILKIVFSCITDLPQHAESRSTPFGDCTIAIIYSCYTIVKTFDDLNFPSAACRYSVMIIHSDFSLSILHAAFAGLVDGRITAGIPNCFS